MVNFAGTVNDLVKTLNKSSIGSKKSNAYFHKVG